MEGDVLHLDPDLLVERMRDRRRPWKQEQLIWVVVANAIGLLLISVGSWAASTSNHQLSAHWFDSQGTYSRLYSLEISILGLIVAGAANAWWLARGRRVLRLALATVRTEAADWSRLARKEPSTFSANGQDSSFLHRGAETLQIGRVGSTRIEGEFLSGPNMTRYHRRDCFLVKGKLVAPDDRERHETAGRQACEVCRP